MGWVCCRHSTTENHMEVSVKRENPSTIAPPWHTVFLVVVLLLPRTNYAWSPTVLSEHNRELAYIVALLIQWLFFGLMYFGLSLNGTKLVAITGNFAGDEKKQSHDIILGFLFLGFSVLITLIFLLLQRPSGPRGEFLPRTGAELVIFIPLALTAGVSEELIFRGYLLKQFQILMGKTPAVVVAQALLFGISHGYHQNLAAFGSNLAFGILLGFLAIWRRSLLPCMVAHSLSDLLAGILSVLLS